MTRGGGGEGRGEIKRARGASCQSESKKHRAMS